MQVHEAISAIDHQEVSKKLQKAREVLEEHLADLSEEDYETRGTYYYYLLRISLRSHLLFESEVEKHFYKKLKAYFLKQEARYLKNHRENPNDNIVASQIMAFYRLMDRYFTILTTIYREKGYGHEETRVYLEKMKYRLKFYKFQKNYFKYVLYKLFEMTSLFGVSFMRWGMTCLFSVCFYTLLYWISGGLARSALESAHWYDALHFSIATFTTLGFGDVFPATLTAKIIADLEVFNGYFMLGVFMALVQKRLF